MIRRVIFAAAAVAASHGVAAQAAGDRARGEFVSACIGAAAAAHHLPPVILVILLNVENGRLGEVSRNSNRTVDIGPMQVNDIWLPKLAVHWRTSKEAAFFALRDEICPNIEGGAWILRQALDEARGDLWEAVGFYHSHNEEKKTGYLRQVLAHAWKLQREASVADAVAGGAPR